jgi:hypothetical protein
MSTGMQSSCLAYCIMSIWLSFLATSVVILILLFTPVTEHVHQHNFLLYIISLSINISKMCVAFCNSLCMVHMTEKFNKTNLPQVTINILHIKKSVHREWDHILWHAVISILWWWAHVEIFCKSNLGFGLNPN